MKCPECKIDLQMDKSLKGILWQCQQCSGVAANLAVLRKLLGQDVASNFWREAMSSTPANRPCPSCHQALHAFKCDVDHNAIELDLCKRCQIIWFDKGELEAFPIEAVAVDDMPSDIKQRLALAKTRANPFNSNFMKADACPGRSEAILYLIIRIITHIILRG